MKSKATLSLIEQLIMVLVFAVAAAVCLRVFSYADSLSQKAAEQDMACIQAQNAAELLKSSSGDYSETAKIMGASWSNLVLTQNFDENWNPTESSPKYILRIRPENKNSPYLSSAIITVESSEELFSIESGNELFSLRVCWQEVSP